MRIPKNRVRPRPRMFSMSTHLDPGRTARVRIGASALVLALALASCGDSSPAAGQARPSPGNASPLAHGHDAPGETCFICDPAQREAGRLWCEEHARYEDRCWLCHPELEDQDRLYCAEHGLYEDECSLCRPGPGGESEASEHEHGEHGAESSSSSGAAPPAGVLFCNEHRVPEEQCGICQPQLAAELDSGDELQVRFESLRSAAKADIRTVSARSMEATEGLGVICEVSYNQNDLARITPLAGGIVRRVRVDVGADVEADEVLVEIHSAEVAEAKAAFVSADVDLQLKKVASQRERRLAEKQISSEKELQEADAARTTAELALGTARQRLLNYGFTEAELEAIQTTRDTSAAMLVRAPFAGTLVEREAVVGEAVEPGDKLFTLTSLDTMWLTLSIPADRAFHIRPGLTVEAAFDVHSGVQARGEITWVDTSVDERSRMLRARAVVDNTDRTLTARTFGEAKVLLSAEREVVGVPRAAIQFLEDAPYVFVRVEDDLFSLRRVSLLGGATGDLVAVADGLRADEAVVTDGAFTVLSEFLKSRLGAGCVDD